MKALEFKEQNIVFAKDQEGYLPLPACVQNNGIVTFCMELDEEEIEKAQKSRQLFITRLTFKGPVQPVKVSSIKPKLPVDHKGFTVDVLRWDKNGKATFAITISPMEANKLKKDKILWISTATFGSPLQPISMGTKIPKS